MVRPGDDRCHPAGLAGLPHQLRRHRRGRIDHTARPLESQLVEPGAQPLGTPARVDEHDRRPVRLDQVQYPFLDRRPDRRRVVDVLLVVQLGHVRYRHNHADLDRLGARRLDHRHRGGPAEEPRGLVDRPYRRRQPDPLRRPRQQGVEPLQRQRQVRAPLGGAHRVYLVDDHRLDAPQRLP